MKKRLLLVSLLFSICMPSQIFAQANIPPSEIQANSLSVEQLQQAAQAGDPDAQYALGYMYYYGKNVPQNTSMGLNWIKRASVQDQQQAVQAIRMLAPSGIQTKVSDQSSVTDQDEQIESNAQSVTAMSSDTIKKFVATEDDVDHVPEIKNVSANDYTIQLLVTSNKTELNHYVQMYALDNKATYYAAKKNGRAHYVLLYGNYKTRSEAQADLLKLPLSVKGQKPWIKQVKQVKRN